MSRRATRSLTLNALTFAALSLASLASVAHGGGQQTETAYRNFPEVPSGWYATGCCAGAVVVEDAHFAAGTEGMQLAEVQARLYVFSPPDEFTLHIYHFDEDTGMPGELLGTKSMPPLQVEGFQVVTVNVWDMDIRIPASGRLWIGFYVPASSGGWNISNSEPSIGSSQNFYARNPGDGFTVSIVQDEEIEFSNLMLSVEVAPDPCPADTNNDNQVDVVDMIAVILDWGCTEPPGPCTGDVNADGVVDVLDMLEVILAWGNCFDV